ncbi:MAG: transcriptional regulator [Acidimicrobiia bacterium]
MNPGDFKPYRSDPDFLILHTLRCIGVAAEERISTASGLSLDETLARLHEHADRQSVSLDPGPFRGWSLTGAGERTERELTQDELLVADARDVVTGCYERFLVLNPKLLQISTDWQIRRFGTSQSMNDHTDPDYDNNVLSRLIRIDDRAQPICVDLASRLLRFGLYADRLARALDRSLAGESAYVSDNLNSYHTVWFQLHEDLLTTLGISREEERRRTSG